MMDNEIELVILAGVVISLIALGAALLRDKKPDPKMAFLLALLQNLPADREETGESDKSGDANEPARQGSGPGSRISDFIA